MKKKMSSSLSNVISCVSSNMCVKTAREFVQALLDGMKTELPKFCSELSSFEYSENLAERDCEREFSLAMFICCLNADRGRLVHLFLKILQRIIHSGKEMTVMDTSS